MADRFNVVAVRIDDEGAIVARMVLGAKPRTAVVTPTRRHGRLRGRHQRWRAHRQQTRCGGLALADPEVRLASPPESRCRDAGFYDQLVVQRGEGFREEALAPLEIRHGNTYMIQHSSHLPRPKGPNRHPAALVSSARRSSTMSNLRVRSSASS